MKLTLVIVFVLGLITLTAEAQTPDIPDAKIAVELKLAAAKIGLPADSAGHFLRGFTKMPVSDEHEIPFISRDRDVVIIFETNDKNKISSIECNLRQQLRSTAQKAIDDMGLKLSGASAPAGYTAYEGGNKNYKVYLGEKDGAISFIIAGKSIKLAK